MKTIKIVEIPNTPLHLLRVTDVKRDDNKALDPNAGIIWGNIGWLEKQLEDLENKQNDKVEI